jgi:cytochrome c peroxidase
MRLARPWLCLCWVGVAGLVGCGEENRGTPYVWDLPAHFPEPRVPAHNPVTVEKVELGRKLFFDERLSGNETQSCASCHAPERAFTDGQATSVGSTGMAHARNAPTLVQVAYAASLAWGNPLLVTLEQHGPVPLFGEQFRELAIRQDDLVQRMSADPEYVRRFDEAFPGETPPILAAHVVEALASFQRTLIDADAPFDRWMAGEEGALSESALRGMALFHGDRYRCGACHGNPVTFSDSFVSAEHGLEALPFHNIGLYDIDGEGAYPAPNVGVMELTTRPADMGRFKAPTLRNVELTAPYMHDGSVDTLEAVLDIFIAGGRHVTEGPHAGDGRRSPLKSPLVTGVPDATEAERADLVAFLRALTGIRQDPAPSAPTSPFQARLGE